MILSHKKKYLQIAFNSTLSDALGIIAQLPPDDRIILEAGTPLIKEFGMDGIRTIRAAWAAQMRNRANPYVVADMKTMDRAETEVRMVKDAGAAAAVCLGLAPLETINRFIETCTAVGLDSMVDMMNVEFPLGVLRHLKKQPDVVILHRGVDEEAYNKDKPIPYVQINKVLSGYNVMISIAGGDSIREVQRAVFNGANIVVVWKDFYRTTGDSGKLAQEFITQIK